MCTHTLLKSLITELVHGDLSLFKKIIIHTNTPSRDNTTIHGRHSFKTLKYVLGLLFFRYDCLEIEFVVQGLRAMKRAQYHSCTNMEFSNKKKLRVRLATCQATDRTSAPACNNLQMPIARTAAGYRVVLSKTMKHT